MKYLLWPLVLALTACSEKPEPPAPPPSVQVQVAAAMAMPVSQTLAAYGAAEFDPASTRALAVQFEAQAFALYVASGQTVRAGQPLLTLSPSANTQLELDRLARAEDLSTRELERLARLRDEGLATNAEVQAAQYAALNARDAHRSLAARTGGGNLNLLAPADGVVETLSYAPGDVIPAGSVVARLGTTQHLRVRLGVEPEDLPQVRVGAAVHLHQLHDGAADIAGLVVAVDKRVDAQTRLAGALVILPADSGVLPGEVLSGRIVIATHEHALAVPRSAVLYDAAQNSQAYVFVANGGKAQRKNVNVGLDDGHDIEILAGLTAGENVIVQGNYELSDDMAIRTATAAVAPKP
ncbi:MAG: efflux RND transporter periplasmic adaptor subunit [Stenotrophobium sp.]